MADPAGSADYRRVLTLIQDSLLTERALRDVARSQDFFGVEQWHNVRIGVLEWLLAQITGEPIRVTFPPAPVA